MSDVSQSAAFKVLRTRLKTIPPWTLTGEYSNISFGRRTSAGVPYPDILSRLASLPSTSRAVEDGKETTDAGREAGAINFALRLQQFEQMQRQHRYYRLQSQLGGQSQRPGSGFVHQEPQISEGFTRTLRPAEIGGPSLRAS
eukprot:TRINITY_DN7357_c0_g1_i1.p1 TRINITY_DN7357_c0_g1~~TRINITY_DN7357_c0_g1_i1.p1  ORF type:complete len:142 (+),score=27.33 TRINITY_DN7357_c0_g1_i1:34-459(+)